MTNSILRNRFEDYLLATSTLEQNSIVSSIVNEIFKNGFAQDSLKYFSSEFDIKKQQEVIQEIFQQLAIAVEIHKYEVMNVLSTFIIETTDQIQKQILPIYIKNLSNKTDFKLVFTTLKIFTSKWDILNDDLRKQLFQEFLVILDNNFALFVEEGAYELTKVILTSKSSSDPYKELFIETELKEYLEKLIKIALKGNKESLNATLASIKEVLQKKPSFLTQETYKSIFPLFKKFLKKTAIFYPAKRDFIKVSLTFIELMLLFENQHADTSYIKNLRNILERMTEKIDHADIKYFLELILFILKNAPDLPKIEILKPSFKVLRDINNKKDRMDDYISNLIDKILNLLWNSLDDEDKDFFYNEVDENETIV